MASAVARSECIEVSAGLWQCRQYVATYFNVVKYPEKYNCEKKLALLFAKIHCQWVVVVAVLIDLQALEEDLNRQYFVARRC